MISVIMPCYNASKYLNQAIESVLDQDFNDLELIIVDDGSTDNSIDIVNSYNDTRIKLHCQNHMGACVARNRGVEYAKGEYLKFLDADDVLSKNCLQTQYEQIIKLDSNQVPFGDYHNINEDSAVISSFCFGENPNMLDKLKEDQPYFFFSFWHVLISCPLLRKKDFIKCGGYDLNLKRGQESDFHFRLALMGVEFIYCPCDTFSYREYTSYDRITSNSRVNIEMMNNYWFIRTNKCERLLLDKYGNVPYKYRTYFAKYWFNMARNKFSKNDNVVGLKFLNKSRNFNPTTFMKIYYFLGTIMGFERLEYFLRLRLKLIGKN